MAAEVIPANVRASPRRRLPIEAIQAWLFLLPAVVILGVFQIFPAIAAFYMSLFKWDVVQGAFRGFGNYTDWLYDNSIRSPDFWRSLSTTFAYVIFTVPLQIALALVLAYLLFQKMRGRGFYRTIYYLPYVTSFVAAAAVFFWVFHPTYGLVNDVIGIFGIGPQRWLDEPNGIFAMAASAFGVTVPDWLAGPTKITLPLLSPTTFFVFTVASIGVLRSFDSVYVLTNGFGGPRDTTRTVTLLVFKTAFQQAQFGLGAALAFILTIIILLFTLIQFRVLGRRVNYG